MPRSNSESDNLQLASSLVEKEWFHEAIPLLKQILSGNPAQALAHYLLGFSMHLSGHDADQAIHHYSLSLQAGMAPYFVHMNRGVLYAEVGNYSQALQEFRLALSCDPHPSMEIVRAHVAQIEAFEANATPEEKAAPYRPPLGSPEYTFRYLERFGVPQSVQFMVDCLPDIRLLFQLWPWDRTVEVLDVGASSGAGANLLALLHQERCIGPKMKVTALDIKRTHLRYARRMFPLLDYRIGDVFQLPPAESWDLVLCSHTIEHMKDPTRFIHALRKRARHWALFYAPYGEKALLPGHLISLTDEIINQWKPLYSKVLVSPAWCNPSDEQSRTVIFVLPGGYKEAAAGG